MDVQEIVTQWLLSNGYDGLYDDDCGCGLNDLFPCCSDPSHCKPGVRVIVDGEEITMPRKEPTPMTNADDRIAELEAKLATLEAENRRLREAIEKAKRALSMGSTTREREAWQALTEQIAREAREG